MDIDTEMELAAEASYPQDMFQKRHWKYLADTLAVHYAHAQKLDEIMAIERVIYALDTEFRIDFETFDSEKFQMAIFGNVKWRE